MKAMLTVKGLNRYFGGLGSKTTWITQKSLQNLILVKVATRYQKNI